MESLEQIEKFQEFIDSNYKKELHEVIRKGNKSLLLDFQKLAEFDHELAEELLDDPEEVIRAAELSLENFEKFDTTIKNFRIRFKSLPKTQEIMIRNIRSVHLGKFLSFEGLVRQSSDVRPQVTSAKFECPSCGTTISILQIDTKFKEPTRCSCGRRGRFRLINKDLVDAQRLIIEESPESLEGGEQPKRLAVFLKEDLVEPKMEKKTTPGSKVRIICIIKEIPIQLKTGAQSIRYDLCAEANFIEPIEQTYEEIEITPEEEKQIKLLAKDPRIYEKLVNSIAPSIYGHDKVKEALVLQLMGGVTKIREDGTKTRGLMHILLVGDPGAAKSSVLQFISKAAPKARFVAGRSTTSAGITATVTKDEFLRGWALEAGAVVLANHGILCLHPDTKVIFNEEINSIGNLFKEQSAKKIIQGKEKIEYHILKGSTPSFNLDKLEVEDNLTTKIIRKWYNGKILSIKLESGFELKLTPEHQLLDGNSLTWKMSSQFRQEELILAPLKLPENKKEVYLLDIMPDYWKVGLTKQEKKELKNAILKKFSKLSDFNRKFNIDRNYLSGGKQFSIKKFRGIINFLSEYDGWKNRCLTYIRNRRGERLNIYKVTPFLAYILGFIYGDGYITTNKRRTRMGVIQSLKNKEQIKNFCKNWEEVFGEKTRFCILKSNSTIGGRKLKSISKQFYKGSNLLGKLNELLIGSELQNINKLNQEGLKAFLSGCLDSDGCIAIKNSIKNGKNYRIQHAEFMLSDNKEANLNFILSLRRLDCYANLRKDTRGIKSIVRITGREDTGILIKELKKYSIKAKKSNLLQKNLEIQSISQRIPSKSAAKIANKLSRINTSILVKEGIWSTIYKYKYGQIQPSRTQLFKIKEKLNNYLDQELIREIDLLLKRDFFLDKIIDIKEEEYSGYVYDLCISENHNFLANGVMVHNCLDELDKMGVEDTSALHEAMEQQQISIAKANIQATLIAETTILAAANPKLGRFDPYQPIASQIDLPPTLINRFDLIFPVRDIPNKDLDEKIAQRILDLHQKPSTIKSEIPIPLFKKYIAYAKQKVFPELTEQAIGEIKTFYVTLRNTGQKSEEEIKPIPISARQIEALIRLAESSARVRLSNKVLRRDARKAIELLKHCLMQVGFDYETGQIDIDRISTGIPASQRSRIVIIRELMDELEKKMGKSIPLEDLILEAREQGIDQAQVEEAVERMKREGLIFEPKRSFLQKI